MESAVSSLKSAKDHATFPARVRALVRRSEFALICLAALIGAIAGIIVALIRATVHLLHHVLFGVSVHGSLSALPRLDSPLLALVPIGGGIVLGLSGLVIRKWRPRRPIDPIEANALQGGRMSFTDSLLIAGQTVLSTGCGGSVGTEAGFTQAASGFASVVGAALKLRRSDMRTLVGCGAAFGAPLTGAFYAFELGLLTEAYVLRRYTEELEKARRELSGEKWLGEA
jgi:chloride channel protein, CIC family